MSKEYKPSPLPYERVGRWIKDAEGRTVCSMETAFHGKDAVTADVIVAVVNSHATLTADLTRVTAERDRLLTACKLVATWMRRCGPMNTVGAVGEILRHAEDAIKQCEATNQTT